MNAITDTNLENPNSNALINTINKIKGKTIYVLHSTCVDVLEIQDLIPKFKTEYYENRLSILDIDFIELKMNIGKCIEAELNNRKFKSLFG